MISMLRLRSKATARLRAMARPGKFPAVSYRAAETEPMRLSLPKLWLRLANITPL